MRGLRRDQSGMAYTLVVTFTALVTIAIVWNLIGPALETRVFDYAENQMQADGTYSTYSPTFNLITFIWRTWPIFMLVGCIIYLLVASQRRSPDTWSG